MLGAAVGYSLATVRLEAWTSRLGTLQLAWAKSSGIAGTATYARLQQQAPARTPCLLTVDSSCSQAHSNSVGCAGELQVLPDKSSSPQLPEYTWAQDTQ